MKINWTRKAMYLNPNDIIIDERYQRSAKIAHVDRIAAAWSPIHAKQLMVSKRADGKFYCVDGGHRLRGAIEAGINRVDCVVYEGLSVEQEHELFEGQDMSVRLSKIDIFKSQFDRNDSLAIRKSAMLARHGLRIASQRGSDNCFAAIDTLDEMINRWGWEVTDEVFALIKQTWGFDDYTVKGVFIKAVANIYAKIKNTRDLDTFIERVSRYDSKTIRQKANGYASQGMPGVRGVTAALTEFANKKAKYRFVFDSI
jgi:hypothetical protein